MAYKLLYIEDQNPASITSDLQSQGFEVSSLNPSKFEEVVTLISKGDYNAILIDFRLTGGSGHAVFDAPTVAQTQRTKNSTDGRHKPIFLISTEKNISAYYKDFTSNDLFDLSISKEAFQKNLQKYCSRFNDTIAAYETIEKSGYNLTSFLNLNKNQLAGLDSRIGESLENDLYKNNTYKVSRFVYKNIIRSIGVLVGEDVLSARLGVSKASPGWEQLKKYFEDAKYNGIYSTSYNRWWATDLEAVCLKHFEIESLRRLKANQRIEKLAQKGLTELIAVEKLKFSESSNFWTICKDLKQPIDPIDGLEIFQKEIIPWQDKEYISILAALESSDHLKDVKASDKERFSEFAKTLKK